jgi:glycerol uptake facilitator protein
MKYLSEFIGTMFLILLNDGAAANVKLEGSGMKHQNPALMICIASGLAVFIPICIFGSFSGAHFNPAVTLAFAISGQFPFIRVLPYIVSQLAGAFTGACLVWLLFKKQIDLTQDGDTVRSSFCTGPSVKSRGFNLISEIIGTFVLAFTIISISKAKMNTQAAFLIFAAVTSIGMSFGGLTGFAINPARDFGPRLAHSILPIKNKKKDWGYFWIPVLGPLLGAVFSALLYLVLPW